MNPHAQWTWCGLQVSRVDKGWSMGSHFYRTRRQWYVHLFGHWVKYWEAAG